MACNCGAASPPVTQNGCRGNAMYEMCSEVEFCLLANGNNTNNDNHHVFQTGPQCTVISGRPRLRAQIALHCLKLNGPADDCGIVQAGRACCLLHTAPQVIVDTVKCGPSSAMPGPCRLPIRCMLADQSSTCAATSLEHCLQRRQRLQQLCRPLSGGAQI